MAKSPQEILAMPDNQLMAWTLSGEEDSYAHKIGETAINMRASLRMVEATTRLSTYTQRLALATWGIVLITLLTQISLIYLSATR